MPDRPRCPCRDCRRRADDDAEYALDEAGAARLRAALDHPRYRDEDAAPPKGSRHAATLARPLTLADLARYNRPD